MSLTINNIDKLSAEIAAYPGDVEKIINLEFKNFGSDMANKAKLNAPKDESYLRQSIGYLTSNLEVTISANADYAGYVEFGTKKFAAAWVASLPNEWKQLAREVKANGPKGGTFKELVLRITKWVHRKGLGSGFSGDIGVTGTYSIRTRRRTGSRSVQNKQDMQAAYLIARKIVRDGIPSQAFLYPAFNETKISLIRNLKKSLNAK